MIFLEYPDMGESCNSGKYYDPWISRNRLNNFDSLEQKGIQRTTLTNLIKLDVLNPLPFLILISLDPYIHDRTIVLWWFVITNSTWKMPFLIIFIQAIKYFQL